MKGNIILLGILGLLIVLVFFMLPKEVYLDSMSIGSDDSLKYNQSKPWFRNSFYGVSFETPDEIKRSNAKIPEGYEDKITKLVDGYLKNQDVVVYCFYMESRFDTYDKKVGLGSAISNMINKMNGSNLVLSYEEIENNLDDLSCSGTCIIQGKEFQIQGFVYWNGQGKAFLLISFGLNKDLNTMDRIFDSVRIAM